jgi:hypothetical protein
VNEYLGTRNYVASGWVRTQCVALEERGYITISPDGSVDLTEKGATAAVCLGIDPEQRS